MIQTSGLTKKFGDITVVDSLDFTVNDGEIFGIVGPDGSGKSTLLRMLSSILIPDSGKIEINGIYAHENPYQIKEKLAYMPQRFGLYEDLTVEENIIFFGRLFSMQHKKIHQKMDMLYSFSKLGPFKDRLAGQLSGGMKQKLGLACSLVHTPEVLLLDEPTNGVDPVSRREFWDILYELLSQGVTIIVSTAYLDEAERSNRIALMYRGKFIRMGNPKSIKNEMQQKLINIIVENPKMAHEILANKMKTNIIRTGNSLKMYSDNMAHDIKQIKTLLNKHRIRIYEMNEVSPRLEDSFIDIIFREESQ